MYEYCVVDWEAMGRRGYRQTDRQTDRQIIARQKDTQDSS